MSRENGFPTPHKRRGLLNYVGPVALGVLVYSGPLGASPVFSWVPGNLTAISVGLVGVTIIATLFSYQRLSGRIVVPLSLWIIFLLPATHFVSSDYSAVKLLSLLTMLLLCLTAPFLLLQFQVQRAVFLGTLAVCGLLSGLEVIRSGDHAAIEAGLSSDVLLLDGANTISTARIVGTAALVLIAVGVTTSRAQGVRRLVFLTVGLGLVVVMVATGSRGPLAAIIAGVAALILIAPVMWRRRIGSLLILAAGTAAAYWWSLSRDLVSSDRAFAWLSGERDGSTQTREYLWSTAADYITRHPWGAGWGGFSTLPNVPSNLNYPHNLFLEVYVETGWVIGTFTIAFVFLSMRRLLINATEPVSGALFALAIFALVNAMVSGDVNDNRLLWLILATAWLPMSTKRFQVDEHSTSGVPGGRGWLNRGRKSATL